jgi:hypothetical protein
MYPGSYSVWTTAQDDRMTDELEKDMKGYNHDLRYYLSDWKG